MIFLGYVKRNIKNCMFINLARFVYFQFFIGGFAYFQTMLYVGDLQKPSLLGDNVVVHNVTGNRPILMV